MLPEVDIAEAIRDEQARHLAAMSRLGVAPDWSALAVEVPAEHVACFVAEKLTPLTLGGLSCAYGLAWKTVEAPKYVQSRCKGCGDPMVRLETEGLPTCWRCLLDA